MIRNGSLSTNSHDWVLVILVFHVEVCLKVPPCQGRQSTRPQIPIFFPRVFISRRFLFGVRIRTTKYDWY